MDEFGAAGTATILFTDMVGSTELRMRLGDDAADRLRRHHDELLTSAVESNGGTVVKSAGDGIMAAFAAASAGVDAAVAMQRRVAAYPNRADAVEPFVIRVGISVGDITVEDGDFFGEAVIEAARLEAAAPPGEILCTDLVRQLARRRTDAIFVDAGELQLKGLPEPVSTHRVIDEAHEQADPLPAELASSVPRIFCGRTREIAELQVVWAAAAGGTARCCLVSGEPGMGKTSLAAIVARQAVDDGAVVLFGRCDEGLHQPYEPLAGVVRAAIDRQAVGEQAQASDLAALAPLAPDRASSAVEGARSAGPEAERAHLFGAVESLLGSIADDHPLLIVLDDLQWSETPTILLLRYLVRSLRDRRVMVLGTFRDNEIGLGHPLGDLLAESHGSDRFVRVRVGAMSAVDVRDLLEAAVDGELGSEGDQLALQIHEESGGSPFFVTELVAHLHDAGVIRPGRTGLELTADLTTVTLPASIREVIGRRLARLDPAVIETLTTAAVVGQVFELDVIAAVTERDVEDVLDELEVAVHAALVKDSDKAGRFEFTHTLIRTSLCEEIGRTRAALVHRRVAETLERLAGDRLAELAHHWRRASLARDVEKAVEYSRLAGRRDMAGLAWEAAAGQFDQALALLEPHDKSDPALVAETALDLADARRQTGDPAFRDAVTVAARASRNSGRGDLLARSALAGMRAGWWFPKVGVIDREVVDLCTDALTAGGQDDPRRARLLATLATNLAFDRDRGRRTALIEEALMLTEGGDDEARATVLVGEFHALWDPLTLDRREVISVELADLARRLHDRPLGVVAGLFGACCAMERADLDDAEARLAGLQAEVDATRIAHFSWLQQMMLTNIAIIRSEEGVEARMGEVLDLGLAGGNEDAFAAWGGQAAAHARAHGGFGGMREPLEEMVAQFPLLSAWRVGLALAAAVDGDLARASELIDELVGGGRSVPMDYLWMVGQFGTIELGERLDRPDLAARAFDELLPFRGRLEMTASATASFGLVDTALAEAAVVVGRANEAVELASAAVDQAERLRAPYFATRSRRVLAEALALAGRADEAVEVGVTGLASAEAHGFEEEKGRLAAFS